MILKATAERVRERPDLAHVWRNIDSSAEMRDAWENLLEVVGEPEEAGYVVQKNAPPGVPIAIRSLEDPLFGPVVSFGISGPIIELLSDVSYRIPPLFQHDAASMVREIRSSPMLFGYRGSEVVDIDEVERLIQRVAQLQNDLPQVRTLELSLVLAGAARRDRAHRRGPGRAGRRPALGLVRTPDADRPGRHHPELRLETHLATRVTDSTSCHLRTTDDQDRSLELRDAIDHTGYYPEVVIDSVSAAVSGERVVSFYVHHEPTFDRDEVRRHLSVMVLTPSRLIIVHTDEHAGDDLLPEPYTSTSSEAIRLSSVTSVVVTRMVANPTKGPTHAGRGRHHARLGRRQPGRPRAGRLRRPAVRGRPRLHRRAGLRRLLAAGLGRGRRPGRRGPPAVLRRAALRPDPHRVSDRPFVEPAYGHRGLGDVVPAIGRAPRHRRPRGAHRPGAARGAGVRRLPRRRARLAAAGAATPPPRRTSPRCWPTPSPAPPACRRRPRPA